MNVRLLIKALQELAEKNGDLDIRIAPPDDSEFTYDIAQVDSAEGMAIIAEMHGEADGVSGYAIACLLMGRKITLGED